jgi:CDP-paratose 2-epimerase
VPTAIFRMSCIYGPRQMGTEDQGWVAHFLIRALRGEPVSIYGDGMQVRDVLFVEDAVEAYCAAWRRIGAVSGRAFNLGGGPANAVSLLQVLGCIEEITGRRIHRDHADWRAGDQRWYVSDTRRAARELGLQPALPWRRGLAALADWLRKEHPARQPAEALR